MGSLALLGVGAPSAAAWAPTTPGNLIAWFDAMTGVTSGGGTISQWNDQSGNGYNLTQGTGALQPGYSATAWNGANPGVTHNASGLKFMINSGGLATFMNGDNPLVFSVLFAIQPTSVNSTINMVGAWRNDPTLDNIVTVGLSTDGGGQVSGLVGTNGSAGAVDTFIGEDTPTTRMTQGLTYSGGTVKGYRNGVLLETLTPTPNTVAGQNQFLLLCDQFGASNFNGALAELLIYQGLLSDSDAASYHTYAQAKWGGL